MIGPSYLVLQDRPNRGSYNIFKQAMITLRGMTEHKFSSIYNYHCLTKVLYLFMWIIIKLI